MRSIYRIARQELSTLFYSPVAWLILIVFPIQIGMKYADFMMMLGRSERMGHHRTGVTSTVFANLQEGFFINVKSTLFFYIPLLTMGLISRELHSGSIKLLLSSPVKVKDIVLGKFLSMMGYGLILITIILLYGYAGSFFIDNIDYRQIFSGAFGLYMLICAYASIGLFMSSLTSYQVVAAISTLAILGLLNFVGGLFQANDIIRHITYFLSMSGRTEQFINGLISSEDLIYFLLIITFFLSITGMRLQAAREARSFRLKFTRYALLLIGCLVVGYISSRPHLTGYIDMTRAHSQTLGDRSIALIKRMDKPLRITTFVNILGDNYHLAPPEKKSEDERIFNQYRRFMPDLEMEYVYYYDDPEGQYTLRGFKGVPIDEAAKKIANIQGLDLKKILTPAQIRKIVNLGPEENRQVRLLEYGDRKTFLRFYDDFFVYPSEQEIMAALKRLVEPERIPVIRFVTGHEERSAWRSGDADLKRAATQLTNRYSLINQGFDVDTVNLAVESVPSNTLALVLADPKTSLSADEAQKLKKYIDDGGNMLLLTEPAAQSPLDTILQYLGIHAGNTKITQQSKDFAPELVQALFTEASGKFSDMYRALQADSSIVAMTGVSNISYTEQSFKVLPLLKSGNGSAVAVALARPVGKKEQKIIVAADADFISTAELSRMNLETSNFGFITGLFSWFSNGEFPVNPMREKSTDVIDATDDRIMVMRILFFAVLPLCLLIAGTTLLIYRKRR